MTGGTESLLPLVLGVLAVAAALAGWVERLPARMRGWVLPVPAVAAFVLLAWPLGVAVTGGGMPVFRAEWVPQLGLDFALRLDGLGLLLGLLVTGIGSLILLYATGYMAGEPLAGRLYGYLYTFMLAMAGLALADHLVLFFVFWELTSISSYLLIGFKHADAEARQKALQALLVTGLGGMALLAGLILLGNAAGTWHLSELAAAGAAVRAHAHYPAILTLVLLGAFTKSAQFPFHFWLPNAMAAPTPVSAYLHSATMVKAGVFLLALMLPVLGGTAAWTAALATAGSITLLLGGVQGLRKHDLKGILAGTTLAVLGLLTLLLGIGTDKAVLGALLFLLGHSLYKATLFMVAGAVDHETGTRDTRLLGGLRHAMPWTAAAAALAAFSKMGLPPFFGFLGKEYTYKASLGSGLVWLFTAVLVAGNAMMLALAVKSAIEPFWGKPRGALPKHPHEAPWSMRAGPLLLAALGVVIGLVPQLMEPVIGSAKSAALGYAASAEISLWHGFNVPLLLSAFTVVAGLVIAMHMDWFGRLARRALLPGAERVYDGVLAGTLGIARWQTRLLQSGHLRNYLLIIIVSTAGLVTWKLWRFGGLPRFDFAHNLTPEVAVLVFIMLFAAGLAIATLSRLTALLALGVVGFGVALLFALFGAPDLAITQVLVETLTVVLFAWVVYKLPAIGVLSTRRTLAVDAAISAAVGVLVTVLVLKSQAVDFGPRISETLSAWSLPQANGANVVNVILVDFRALDTWGEISVLGIAALGVWALLSSANGKGKGNN